jgi:formimidoylglutamate deiminase
VGSDSNVLINLSEELRLLEYTQRLSNHSRNVMARVSGESTGRTLFDAVLSGGSRALGVPARGLEVGAPADIVSLAQSAARGDQILDSFIFASARSAVDGVWRWGRRLVSGGMHLQRAPIEARFRATLQRLLA